MKATARVQQPFYARFPTPKVAAELRRVLKARPARGVSTLLDQGLLSGSNFVIAVLLARWLNFHQYGAYTLAFEVFLLLLAVYGALVLEPMTVLGTSVYSRKFRGYLAALLRIHCVFSVLILGLAFWGARFISLVQPNSSLPQPLIGVGLASPCLFLFWMARHAFYIHLLPQKAALGAVAYCLVVLLGVLLFYKLRVVTPLAAFLMMAAGAAISAPLMLIWFKNHVPLPAGPVEAAEVVRRHWEYGRWALGSASAIWVSGAIYYPLLGGFFGLAATGAFKALMNLASPIGGAFIAISLLTLPQAPRASAEDGAAPARRTATKLLLLYIGGASLYWLAVLLSRHPLVHLLYGGKYGMVTALLPWLALGSILRIGATSQSIVLGAMQSPKMVFIAYSAACVVAVAAGVPFSRWFGISGALFAWIFSSGVALLACAFLVRHAPSLPQPAGRTSEFGLRAHQSGALLRG